MYQWIENIARQTCAGFDSGLLTAAKSNRRSATQTCSLDYQSMEARKLLAGIVFTAATGQVLIGGTEGDDVARVTESGSSITFDQHGFESRTFSTSEVNSIVFVGLRGDDFFENNSSINSTAYGQLGNDTLIGGSGNDRLVGNGDEDTLRGNDGDDVIVAGIGDDRVDAGAGNDRVIGVGGANVIEGGTGNDTLYGGNDSDTITDVSGDNLITGSNGDDSITGGSGADRIFGGNGDDVIFGAGGNDTIYAQGGNDTVSGGAGDDTLGGNTGDDTLQGEQGNDRIIGGAGTDRANFSGNLSSYEVTPSGPNLRINDLRGDNFGLADLVFGGEEYSFADGVRSQDEILNPPQAAEVITVQPIIASNDDGSNTAAFFGNAEQELEIKNRIDEIFEQADIDVEFLPAKSVNNTFINVGDFRGTRPQSDLDRIVVGGDNTGLGDPDNNVIDLYFVEIVPGFRNQANGVVNGLAFVGDSGIAVHVGDNLLGFADGREIVATVTAHEIGHNLGLPHVHGDDNLLSEEGDSTHLTQEQIDIAIASSISRPV